MRQLPCLLPLPAAAARLFAGLLPSLLLGLSGLLPVPARAQLSTPLSAGPAARPVAAPPADTLFLKAENAGPWGRSLAYCLDPLTEPSTGARAGALAAAGRFRPVPQGQVLQTGFTQDRLWLRAVVVNTLPQRTRFVWSVYGFADSTVLLMQPLGPGASLPAALRREAGSSGRVVAKRRVFPARSSSLPFWLPAGGRAVLYLRIDNHGGAIYLPTDITTTEDFLAYEATFFPRKNWSVLLGFYLGSALFNLILFAFLRDRINLWYGAYVLFTTWFLLMEDGLDALLLPQALYGLGWQLGQFSMLLLALACGLRIMALFVRLPQAWPRLNRLSWGLSLLAAAYAGAYGLLYDAALRSGSQALAWLNGTREVLLWGMLGAGLFLLGMSWARGRPPQRRLARYYALTYLFFFLGSVQFLLNRAGVVHLHFVNPNSLAWGLALELLALSALLTGRFRATLRQNAYLRLRRLQEREAAGGRLIAAQDEEREALARELHDALAPGLTALHLAWQGRQVRQALAEAPPLLTEAYEHTEALLRQLRHDVRALSQVLLPTSPGQPTPLPEAIALLGETLSLTQDGPEVEHVCDAAAGALPAALQAAAYRIVAELLHNALRHAQARHVRVGVHCLPGRLRLCVEDDGLGFDPDALPARQGGGGLGLRGVHARTGYLRGQVLVRSRPGQGTSITVELPV